jgi:hypothetical protein
MYLLFSGFRGTHRSSVPPIHGLEDNVPDVHDEADFDIPETQAVLETFMTHNMVPYVQAGGCYVPGTI